MHAKKYNVRKLRKAVLRSDPIKGLFLATVCFMMGDFFFGNGPAYLKKVSGGRKWAIRQKLKICSYQPFWCVYYKDDKGWLKKHPYLKTI